jgi:hypothetical protein
MTGPYFETYIKCVCCAGHESISTEAATALATIIKHRLTGCGESPVTTELWNIYNAIVNTQEREKPQPCPTPGKVSYSELTHAAQAAVRHKQHGYLCECGFWHLSKQTPTEHAAKINTLAAAPDEFESVIDPLLS